MTGIEIAFFVLAVASIASALGVILFRNAVNSALSLILLRSHYVRQRSE